MILRNGTAPTEEYFEPDFDACHAFTQILLVSRQGVHLATQACIQRTDPLPDQTRQRATNRDYAYKLRAHVPPTPLRSDHPNQDTRSEEHVDRDLTPDDESIQQEG